MRLSHRVHTAGTPAQVWAVLGDPRRWPEFDAFLRRVRGSSGSALAGQHLLGLARLASLRIPVDVVESVPERRLVLLVHTAPGLRETLTYELTPAVRGGTDVVVGVVVEGLLARVGAIPLWLASGLNARLLAVQAAREARAVRPGSESA